MSHDVVFVKIKKRWERPDSNLPPTSHLSTFPPDSKQLHPLRRVTQLPPEVGVRNRYQRFAALVRGLAAQLGHAEFGHHVVDVILAGGHMGAGRQRGHDARDGVVLGG